MQAALKLRKFHAAICVENGTQTALRATNISIADIIAGEALDASEARFSDNCIFWSVR